MLTRRLDLCFHGTVLFLIGWVLLDGFAGSPRAEGAPSRCGPAPTTRDGVTRGTACSDVIVAMPGVEEVFGGGGSDRIYTGAGVEVVDGGSGSDEIFVASEGVGATVIGGEGNDVLRGHIPASLRSVSTRAPRTADCPLGCHLGVGSQQFDGGPGDDTVYGERGNDVLNGGVGNDHLFGGIGDDTLGGGDGNDQLSGGFGADNVDGQAGDDYVRGDGSADTLRDTGGGRDTLSYATGVTPGFPDRQGFSSVAGFPSAGGARGVYVDLGANVADNGVAPNGGGVDPGLSGADFENVIGTPFSDYIVGSPASNTIFGGGGGDVIRGEGGSDTLFGGADGDHLEGGDGTDTLNGNAGADHCESSSEGTSCEPGQNPGGVVLRDSTKIAVGFAAPEDPSLSHLYLAGSSRADDVTATYDAGTPGTSSPTVTFASASSSFDTAQSAAAGCAAGPGQQFVCTLTKPLDSVVIAGMGVGDTLRADAFAASTSVVILGGEGSDALTGGVLSEDVVADGPDATVAGSDALSGLGGDDALINNDGVDRLEGGDGNDLFLSATICDGDTLNGGPGRDNASWARFTLGGIEARIAEGIAGRPGSGSGPVCGGAPEHFDHLGEVEDLEGSSQADRPYGGAGANQLLGWRGEDTFSAREGDDTILANSGDLDQPVDCGAGTDRALIDRPGLGDVALDTCELIQESDPNSFRFEVVPGPAGEPTPPGPAEPSPTSPEGEPTPTPVSPSPDPLPSPLVPSTLPDTRPANTFVRSARINRARRSVTFSFASSEVGSTFLCKRNRQAFRACTSPITYLALGRGRHRFLVRARDAAGNVDPTPVVKVFFLGQ